MMCTMKKNCFLNKIIEGAVLLFSPLYNAVMNFTVCSSGDVYDMCNGSLPKTEKEETTGSLSNLSSNIPGWHSIMFSGMIPS